MASFYLDQKKADFDAQAQREKMQLDSEIQKQILDARKGVKSPNEDKKIGCGCASAAIVGIFSAAIFKSFWGVVVITVVVGLICASIGDSKEKDAVKTNNDNIEKQVAALEQHRQVKEREIDAKYARMFEQEKKRVEAAIKAARQKYAGHAATQAFVSWLDERFAAAIQNADRRMHNKYIEAELAFQVNEDRMYTLRKDNRGYYSNAELFDFNINRFTPLRSMEDRIGFAQAIAKLVQLDTLNRFPQDPVAPSGARATISMTSNDTQVTLLYRVDNPNYRMAVTL